ncbi:MAG: Stp1/IreP family PP2C-type Ser/Thr phosphatase [Bulleidia sp.]
MKYYGITDRGLVRKNNQDSYVIATNQANDVFAIVADGIGGNSGGDIASGMAVSMFSAAFSETDGFSDAQQAMEWIRKMITMVNYEIFSYGASNPKLKGMGTTLSGVMLTGFGKIVVNIGDSRTYAWWKNGRFKQITMDHSLVNDMIMHGELTPEEAKNSPRKNVLTNALGVWPTVRGDIALHQEKMDGFLICSDGLHGYVDEKKIISIVMNPDMDPSLRARNLMKAALEAGGYDNVTVIFIDLEEAENVL